MAGKTSLFGCFSLTLASFVVFLSIVLAYLNFSERIFTAQTQALIADKTSIFNFTVDSIDSNVPISLSEFQGKKVYLVVNVASQCGLTNTNYIQLQNIYDKFSVHGLEILAFPCNNFGGQEPASNSDILSYVRNTREASFPILGKIECDNRDKTHPLYVFLKNSLSGGILGPGLKWNFAKFLCDENGIPIKRFAPTTSPEQLEDDIKALLGIKDTYY